MRRLVVIVCAATLIGACKPSSSTFDSATTPSVAPVVDSSPIASPTPSPSPSLETPPASPSPAKPACKEGKHQLEVEQALNELGGYGKLSADGQQSDADCVAIKKFQTRFGLRPIDGVPGGATLNVAKRLLASDPGRCGAGSGLTACIDLTHQTTWIMRDGKVIHGPTVTRTGYDHPDGKGAPTPAGSFKIIERQRSNYTESFDVYLHYWQRIMGNNGFHETTSYIHDMSLGSHGCVNLLKSDAIAYWETLKVGTPVKVFGRRPGT
ncbi:L,D-transpeptidase family protein [Allorhizocola rhizosphaerae]|uniref:L,D-transpeptidase family protein n=1 Tax=Allorhizocola rhizosphaerae TaxID=1872709 RepID=UPI000E3E53C2|nr:L,D-transpeptidase family protein [Allorhizocola rhizosphaerae]